MMKRLYSLCLSICCFAQAASGQSSGMVGGDFSTGRSFGPNQHTHQLQMFDDGSILVGWPGDFFSGEKNYKGLVKLKPDGSIDQSFVVDGFETKNYRPHLQADGSILMESLDMFNTMIKIKRDLTKDEEFRRILTTGNFFFPTSTGFMEVPVGKVGSFKKYSADGIADRTFNAPRNPAYSGFITLDDDKFMALHLDSFKLKRYTSQGVVDPTFNCTINFSRNGRNGTLMAMKALQNGEVLVYHPFIGIRKLTNTGALEPGYSIITPFLSGHLLAFTNDGYAYLAEPVQGRWQIRRHEPNGRFDPGFVVGTSFSGVSWQVDDFTHKFFVQGNQLCYLGFDRQFQYRFVRLLDNGTLDVERTSEGLNAAVNILVIDGSKKILAAGQFDKFNDRSFPGLIRLLPSGEVDGTFNSPLHFTKQISPGRFPVKSVSLLENGKMVVVTDANLVEPGTGPFKNLYVLQENGDTVANWQPDTSGMGMIGRLDKLLSAKASTGNTMYLLTKLKISGFNNYKTVLYKYLENGQKDPDFQPFEATGLNGLHTLSNGELFVSQSYRWPSDIQPYTISKLIKLKHNGQVDTTFRFPTIANSAGGISQIQKLGRQYLITTVAYQQNIETTKFVPEAGLIKLDENGRLVSDFSFTPVPLPADTVFDHVALVLANEEIGTVLPTQTKEGFSLLRRNLTWESDSNFISQSLGFGTISCMVQIDTVFMLIGGSFSHYGGAANYGLAKVINKKVEPLSLAQKRKPKSLQVYPNPGFSSLHVQLEEQKGLIQVFDLQGKCMYSGNIEAGNKIESHSWRPGFYHVKVSIPRGTFYHAKWVKE